MTGSIFTRERRDVIAQMNRRSAVHAISRIVMTLAFLGLMAWYVGSLLANHHRQINFVQEARASDCAGSVSSYRMSTSSLEANLKELCSD